MCVTVRTCDCSYGPHPKCVTLISARTSPIVFLSEIRQRMRQLVPRRDGPHNMRGIVSIHACVPLRVHSPDSPAQVQV
jgi:hypothetical protein